VVETHSDEEVANSIFLFPWTDKEIIVQLLKYRKINAIATNHQLLRRFN
jgi:hypothetical protein